jgi:hypothetical protein
VTLEEAAALRALVDRLTWRACKPDYAREVGDHSYVVKYRTIGVEDWNAITAAISATACESGILGRSR